MNRELIGVGTSISKEKNFDPMDTLLFSRDNTIAIVQVYLDYDLIDSPDYIREIREFAKENNISLTCHSPEKLNKKTLSESILSAVGELLIYQKEKRIVVHFDEQEPLKDILTHIEKMNKNNLTVCLENYYEGKDEKTFLGNIDTYNSIFNLAEKYKFSVYPVIDFPRLFISDIFNRYDSLVLAEQAIDNCAKHSFRVILHLIDFLDYSQQRDSWCALGKGLMPYKAIFDYAREREIIYDHCILEFEDKKLTLESMSETENI